jgi:prepilin-type N-terminal cleavage/methylation domain-containing protein
LAIGDFGSKTAGRGSPGRCPAPRSKINNPKSKIRRAFTLVEMLIVIGLILLIILIALPAFNAMSGSRSLEGAQNQISALLNRARMEAIGLQEHRGLLFYIDPTTQRVTCALVAGTVPPSTTSGLGATVYLDLVPEREYLVLPAGVGVQTFSNAAPIPANSSGTVAAARRNEDGYVGFNYFQGDESNVKYGGVILFDGVGRVINDSYGFLIRTDDPDGAGPATPVPTELGRLLHNNPNYNGLTSPTPAVVPRKPQNQDVAMRSQLGLALYDLNAFRGANEDPAGDPLRPDNDPQGAYTRDGPEDREETWLDQNGLPLLVNRFNGTLVKGG